MRKPTLAEAIKNVIKVFPGTTFYGPQRHAQPERKRRNKKKPAVVKVGLAPGR